MACALRLLEHLDSWRCATTEEVGDRFIAARALFNRMDSLMSGMDGMGMDMSSDPMFRTYNQVLARGYWYVIAFVVGFLLLLRAIEYRQNWSR